MCIIITGNPVDGFKFYGPFNNYTEAVTFAEDTIREADWWVAKLQKESENAKGI